MEVSQLSTNQRCQATKLYCQQCGRWDKREMPRQARLRNAKWDSTSEDPGCKRGSLQHDLLAHFVLELGTLALDSRGSPCLAHKTESLLCASIREGSSHQKSFIHKDDNQIVLIWNANQIRGTIYYWSSTVSFLVRSGPAECGIKTLPWNLWRRNSALCSQELTMTSFNTKGGQCRFYITTIAYLL